MRGVRTRVGGRRVTVVGIGRSGLSVAELLVASGATVCLLDEASAERIEPRRLRRARALGQVRLGPIEASAAEADWVVVSPGVPPASWERRLEEAGVPVVSEVEVASWGLRGATVIGVTGTNGKSTVTTVIGEACRRSGSMVFTGGNLGRPAAELARDPAAATGGFVVLELSSFQLARTRSLAVDVAVLLNLAPDHLDWHGSERAYFDAKGRLFEMQREGAHAVAPHGDERCDALLRRGVAVRHHFGEGHGEVRLEGDVLRDEVAGWSEPLSALAFVGRHQHLGLAAAALAARLGGVGTEAVRGALRSSHALPHRMQVVGEAEGVRFVDDSKATNVAAAVAALRSLARDGSVVLLAGGRAKGESFEPLALEASRLGVRLVAFGEAAEAIQAAMDARSVSCERVRRLEEAVARALVLAEPGGTVLLSPACASFDAFPSYAARGEAFARLVEGLSGTASEEER